MRFLFLVAVFTATTIIITPSHSFKKWYCGCKADHTVALTSTSSSFRLYAYEDYKDNEPNLPSPLLSSLYDQKASILQSILYPLSLLFSAFILKNLVLNSNYVKNNNDNSNNNNNNINKLSRPIITKAVFSYTELKQQIESGKVYVIKGFIDNETVEGLREEINQLVADKRFNPSGLSNRAKGR